MSQYGRSAQEEREHDLIRYPGSDVLINKFNLRNPALLEVAERQANEDRLLEGLPEAAREQSVAGMKAIHRHLFQDVYEWAGEFRRYTSGRGSAPFAVPEQIEPSLDQLFEKLTKEDCLRGAKPEEFTARAAHYVNEINAAHPFVEGNGRTQRVWLQSLAEQAGYDIEFRSADREAWYKASARGFYQSDDAMTAFIGQRLRFGPERIADRGDISERIKDQEAKVRERIKAMMDRSSKDRDQGIER